MTDRKTETDRKTGGGTREYDLLVIGITGIAGRAVAEHLVASSSGFAARVGRPLTQAFAGRSVERMQSVRERCMRQSPDAHAPELIELDLDDESSVAEAVRRAAVVISTVGPYSRYGSTVVAECAAAGTHYLDLTGELPWVRRMIREHQGQAERSGACLVPCCGFDSVPSDLGVMLARDEFQRRYAGVPAVMRFVMGAADGGFSGGTVASLLTVIETARRSSETRNLLSDPDSLLPEPPAVTDVAPGPRNGTRSVISRPRFDRNLAAWTVPFFMGIINERVVRRSNALSGFPLGKDPDYREVLAFGSGVGGALRAAAAAAGTALFGLLLMHSPTRRLLAATVLPGPGKGPSQAERGEGSFRLKIHAFPPAEETEAAQVTVEVSSNRDPGYGATAIMISEGALLLLERLGRGEALPAGFQTPACAGGRELIDRLNTAGVRFKY